MSDSIAELRIVTPENVLLRAGASPFSLVIRFPCASTATISGVEPVLTVPVTLLRTHDTRLSAEHYKHPLCWPSVLGGGGHLYGVKTSEWNRLIRTLFPAKSHYQKKYSFTVLAAQALWSIQQVCAAWPVSVDSLFPLIFGASHLSASSDAQDETFSTPEEASNSAAAAASSRSSSDGGEPRMRDNSKRCSDREKRALKQDRLIPFHVLAVFAQIIDKHCRAPVSAMITAIKYCVLQHEVQRAQYISVSTRDNRPGAPSHESSAIYATQVLTEATFMCLINWRDTLASTVCDNQLNLRDACEVINALASRVSALEERLRSRDSLVYTHDLASTRDDLVAVEDTSRQSIASSSAAAASSYEPADVILENTNSFDGDRTLPRRTPRRGMKRKPSSDLVLSTDLLPPPPPPSATSDNAESLSVVEPPSKRRKQTLSDAVFRRDSASSLASTESSNDLGGLPF